MEVWHDYLYVAGLAGHFSIFLWNMTSPQSSTLSLDSNDWMPQPDPCGSQAASCMLASPWASSEKTLGLLSERHPELIAVYRGSQPAQHSFH